MPSSTWITTDTHWFDTGLWMAKLRPKDHTERSIKRHKASIGPRDTLIHLGDVIWQPSALYDIIKNLGGHRVLIRGNHDKKTDRWYLNNGFNAVFDAVEYRSGRHLIHMTHKPRLVRTPKTLFNLHGHIHTDYTWKPEWHNHKLALEETHYYPVKLEQLVREYLSEH
jgi:calcineurin-like phosphoesterase family protein